MAKSSRSFVIVGLGSFGSVVATELARFGNKVLGIDCNEQRVAKLAEQLSSVAILNATDEAALREAGAGRYDFGLVSIGNDLESSILASMNLRLVGVPTVWAKADNRTQHRILSKIGVDRVVLPDLEMGRHTAQIMNNPALQDYVALGNGFSVINLLVPARQSGKTIADLNTACLRVLGLMRGTEFFDMLDPAFLLHEGDRLLLLGKRPDLTAFGDRL